MSASIGVADAIATALNRRDFGLAFEAERSYADWDDKLEDMDSIHVDIVPSGYYRAELLDRATTAYGCLTNIAVRKRFDLNEQLDDNTIDLTAIDELVSFCESIHLYLAATRLAAPVDDAIWDSTEMRLEFDRKALREDRQFTGILRVGYLVPVANG